MQVLVVRCIKCGLERDIPVRYLPPNLPQCDRCFSVMIGVRREDQLCSEAP